MLSALWPIPCAGCGSPGPRRICAECATVAPTALPPMELIAGGWAAAPYEGPLGKALLTAKGRPDRALAKALAAVVAPALAPHLAGADALVPVPSPWTRRLSRGFALSSVLAEALAAHTGLPVHHHALVAARGPRQAGLDERARQRALEGRIRGHQPVTGTVVLVDDVLTTGATARACARELLGAGAERVGVAVACVAGSPS